MSKVIEGLENYEKSRGKSEDKVFRRIGKLISDTIKYNVGWIEVGEIVRDVRDMVELMLMGKGDVKYNKVYNYVRNVLLLGSGLSGVVVVEKYNGGILKVSSLEWYKRKFKNEKEMLKEVKEWNRKILGRKIFDKLNEISKKIERSDISDKGLKDVAKNFRELVDKLIVILNEVDEKDAELILDEKVGFGIGYIRVYW